MLEVSFLALVLFGPVLERNNSPLGTELVKNLTVLHHAGQCQRYQKVALRAGFAKVSGVYVEWISTMK